MTKGTPPPADATLSPLDGDPLRHHHMFNDGNPLAERNVRWAALLTAVVMVAEIAGGWAYNSMALLADGWHMSSHTLALGLSIVAYAAARRLAHSRQFAFGTWKIEILGGYTSAVALVGVAGLMLYQSVERLITPSPIHYDHAIALAVLGLLVNLACAWLLHRAHHHHHHDHGHGHGHHHHGHDLNLRSAYLHVVADAATSVLAIVALMGGKYWDATWLDPVMGIAGSGLVSVWAYGLLRDTGRVLLDAEMASPATTTLQNAIAAALPEATITDLHLWRVGRENYACILCLATADPMLTPNAVRQRLQAQDALAHLTVEINR